MLSCSPLKLHIYNEYVAVTRQSVACNARRHPVVEHQDTCTCNIIIIAI